MVGGQPQPYLSIRLGHRMLGDRFAPPVLLREKEGTHEGRWTEHIHDDGVVKGTLEGVGDTASAAWNKDVVDMADKVGNAVTHPVDTAKKVWQGLGDLL